MKGSMAKAVGLGLAAVLTIAVTASMGWRAHSATPPMAAADAAKLDAWDFNLVAIDGEPMPMKTYKGKVVMLVNTASFCGFTPQYEGLQKINDAYAARGFTVIGVPSGDFMGQEYKDNKEIAGFCKTKGVRFPLAERSEVVGKKAIPIYRWAAARLGPDNVPKWNFHKYLIGRDGKLIAAYGSKTTPEDPKLRAAVEKALAAPAA